MRLRPKKKICEEEGEADERGQKKRKVAEMTKLSSSSRQNPIVVPGIGSSPAKKPRTHRSRAPGNKPPIPHFLLDPVKKKNSGKSQSPAQDDDNSDDDDFNNVVKAVAMTLAEVSQNESESPEKGEDEDDKAREVSDDEVGNEPAKPTQKPRRATDPPERRPPSKRIKTLKDREREREREQRGQERENGDEDMGAVEDSKPQKRVLPQRSKKKGRQLFSSGQLDGGEDVSGLDTLATLAGMIPDTESERGGGDGEPEELQELVSQVLSLQVERPSKKQPEAKDKKSKAKQQLASPKKKKPPGGKSSGEASSSGKHDDKASPFVYKPHGVTKRVSSTKQKASKQDDASESKKVSKATRPATRTEQTTGAHCKHTTPELGISSTKARLLHCLGSGRETEEHNVRQWCIYEWFYSAIDLPWFSQNEFVEYLHHAGLGHVSKLTRIEWGVIRNSLGKPRRLSQKFLQEERQKLADYRENVRKYYHEHRNDKPEALPPDLPRPLTVGQRVIARHPRTGEINDGSILTVDWNKCRVQFDRTDLGVEFVQDIDTMPVNPLDNMSEQLKKKRVMDSSRLAACHLNDRLDRPVRGYSTPSQYFLSTLFHRAQMDNVDAVLLAKAAASEAVAAVQQGEDAQEREADICALAELTRQLDKKEALLVELRRMNDEADKTAGEAEPLGSSEVFQRQYATVVLQLKEVNKQVAAAVLHLRERNRYKDNLVPPWHSPPSSSSLDPATTGLGAGSPAEEITLTARKDARSLVSATVQAICCLQQGESDLSKLGKAHNNDKIQPGTGESSANTQQGSDKPDNSSLQPAGSEKVKKEDSSPVAVFSSSMKRFIPKEYIASCVTTILMIQMCAERCHLPRSDVAVMFENALANLRPRSAQNHQLYKEVEQLVDVLKAQVTAEVSFRPNVPPPLDCFSK